VHLREMPGRNGKLEKEVVTSSASIGTPESFILDIKDVWCPALTTGPSVASSWDTRYSHTNTDMSELATIL
jgi:hypothetical protein